jgi:PKD repeat protein
MQKTANQIKSEFELLASGHYQIHSFLYAQEFEQQAYENLIYPLMLVYPLGGSLSGTSYTRNYRVVIADRVLKSEGNELEVESDTQLIALDTLAYWMKLGTNERFSITSSNTITPFWEKWGDEVTGHFVDIGIEEFYDFNSCAIPLSSAIPSPTNPCKDARILINSVVYGNAPSDSNFNVVVKNQAGALVGSLIGGEWIVNTGAGCLDSTYTITNSTGTTLYTGTIPSGGSLTQAISNSTLNVNNSAGSLISSRSIVAQGTSSYNVADSTITNAAVSPTYSQLVKATEGLILPTQSIQNNGVASGFIPSVGTINVTTNAAPTSFTITGRTIDIVVPSGSTPMDVDFSADKLTAEVGETITFTDLSDQTPTHWSWRFNGDGVSLLQNPTFSFLTTGFKNIILLAGKVGAGGVSIKNNYIEIIASYFIGLFGNPNAGYSLRKLSAGATNCIRVRRSSDNTEQDIGFVSNTANSPIDTTALLNFVGAGNGFVTTWYDQSSNAKNATQTTAANQPQIVTSGVVNLENGLPTMSFDGTRFLSYNTQSFGSNAHIIMLTKSNAATPTGIFAVQNDTNADFGIQLWNFSSQYTAFNSTTANSIADGVTANGLQKILQFGRNGSSESYFQRNNTFNSITPTSQDTSSRNYFIGTIQSGSFRYNGTIQELIIYNSTQYANLNNITTNLNDYYNVF